VSNLLLFDDPITAFELGQMMRHRREAVAFTREDLAQRVHGLVPWTVKKWESGLNLVHVETYFRAMEALGCRASFRQSHHGIVPQVLTP
jgi:hypothetical protein